MILKYKITMLSWILNQVGVLQSVIVSPNDFGRLLAEAEETKILVKRSNGAFTVIDPTDSNLDIHIVLHPHVPDCKNIFL